MPGHQQQCSLNSSCNVVHEINDSNCEFVISYHINKNRKINIRDEVLTDGTSNFPKDENTPTIVRTQNLSSNERVLNRGKHPRE
jgi:hypothetical protein